MERVLFPGGIRGQEEKRRKQRVSLSAIFVDPLAGFSASSVVLDDELLNKETFLRGPLCKALDNQPLVFKTKTRPKNRYLYFLCLITLFRRRRFMIKGWERDQEKIQMGKIWRTPGKWMRRSIVRALALEIGDVLPSEQVFDEEDIDTRSFSEKLSFDKERQIAVQVHDAIERRDVDRDDD